MDCRTLSAVRLDRIEILDPNGRPPEFAVVGADAHREHVADPGQQRMFRAADEQHLQPEYVGGGVRHGEQIFDAGFIGARPVERQDQKQYHCEPGVRPATHDGAAGDPRQVQDRLGDPHAPLDRHVGGSRCIHLPEPELEFMARRPDVQLTHVDALLLVEEGAQNGDVLFAPEGETPGATVHGGTGSQTHRRGDIERRYLRDVLCVKA